MWELDHKEDWGPKNWCFQIVMLEKMLESPLGRKEIKPVNPKGSQPWIFTGRTDAETEAPILWPTAGKSWVIGKNPDAGKDRRQGEKGMTQGEMVGWYHRLNGHEFEQALGVGGGWGSLASCSPWGGRELDTTEWLNSNNNCISKTPLQALATKPSLKMIIKIIIDTIRKDNKRKNHSKEIIQELLAANTGNTPVPLVAS